MQMKEIFLDKKWIGAIALCIYALISSLYVSRVAKEFVAGYLPVVVEEAKSFLPITIQNGQIVDPHNQVISKTYGHGKFNVVLDTRIDEFATTDLQTQGLYLSKKYLYGVRSDRIEVRSLSDLPDATLNNENLQSGAYFIQQKINNYLFIILFVVCISLSALMILIYTGIMHWLLHIMYGAKFAQTLRITTLFYVLIGFGQYIGLHPGFFATLLILCGANIFVNYVLKNS
jgi:hypothetical protein